MNETTTYENGLECRYCGKHDRLHWNEGTRQKLIKQHACHGCGFWLDHAKGDKNHNADRYVLTSDYEHYMIGLEDDSPGKFRGFGGAKFYIDWNDAEKSTTITTNLWSQGVVDERMRDRFEVNAAIRSA